MRKHQYIILGIILILILLLFVDIHVVYTINGNQFKLKPDNEEVLKEKAEILYELKQRMNKLVEYMKENSIPDKTVADRLNKRFKNTELRETSLLETSTGYTLKKGSEIRLCINKDITTNEYNINLIMFILLHEMAHIMSFTYGHNEEFSRNMDIIVKTASKIGFYKPRDFSLNPVSYCGTYISNSPCNGGNCIF